MYLIIWHLLDHNITKRYLIFPSLHKSANIIDTLVTTKVMKLKIRKIGNSLGASIPKELLEKLMVREGDYLYPSFLDKSIYFLLFEFGE